MGCVRALLRYVRPAGIEKSCFAGSAPPPRGGFASKESAPEPTPDVPLHAAMLPNPASTSRRLMFIGVPPRESQILSGATWPANASPESTALAKRLPRASGLRCCLRDHFERREKGS